MSMPSCIRPHRIPEAARDRAAHGPGQLAGAGRRRRRRRRRLGSRGSLRRESRSASRARRSHRGPRRGRLGSRRGSCVDRPVPRRARRGSPQPGRRGHAARRHGRPTVDSISIASARADAGSAPRRGDRVARSLAPASTIRSSCLPILLRNSTLSSRSANEVVSSTTDITSGSSDDVEVVNALLETVDRNAVGRACTLESSGLDRGW